jgi:hypothetical protein
MTIKENVNALLKTIGLKAEEVKLAQMKSEDGVTVFEAEEFAPEFSVGIATEEGIVPVPVGEYTLEDGNVMVVAVEGVIAEIKPMEQEVEIEVEAEAEAPGTTIETPVVKKTVESVTKETFFSENVLLKAEIELLKAKLEEKEAKVEVVELAEEKEVETIKYNPENSKTPEVFRYAKGAGQTRLESIINKLNK